MSAQVDQVFAAVIQAQTAFKAIPKGSENPFFHSKYADLPAVIEAAQPVLSANNLGVVHLPAVIDGEDGLATLLVHQTGQYIGAVQRLHLPKQDPQSHGSALTYARRYGFMAVLNLVADQDDDGNSASPREERRPARKSRPEAGNENVVQMPDNAEGRQALRALCEQTAWQPEDAAKLFQARFGKAAKVAPNEDLISFVAMVKTGVISTDLEPQPA